MRNGMIIIDADGHALDQESMYIASVCPSSSGGVRASAVVVTASTGRRTAVFRTRPSPRSATCRMLTRRALT